MKKLAYLSAALLGLLVTPPGARAQNAMSASGSSTKPTIVLVHGAFADALGWQHVIPILEKDGYPVVAVENPLTSLTDDIATTKRVIESQKGPVVLVGHSYGGAVISGAATDATNVKALVYLAAFAPDANEPIGALGEKYPAPLSAALRPDAAGFLYVDRAMFRDVFAKDVPEKQTKVMAAAQKPISGSVFAATIPSPAWKTIPSWYLVSTEDRSINPDAERFYAKRMGAVTKEIKASHVAFISHPEKVAKFIEQAAMGGSK